MHLHTIHGFLGKPSDWDFLSQFNLPIEQIINHNLQDYDPKIGLKGWAATFNSKISGTTNKNILMGYSLGGRLALHSLLQASYLWDKAIIISTDFQSLNQNERSLRDKRDQLWKERFIKEPWKDVIKEWNEQSVFHHSIEIPREEIHYCRLHLAESLIHWSISQQEELFSSLIKLSKPILWIAGENDLKYVAIARKWEAMSAKNEIWIAPKAGHRVPWQVKDLFIARIQQFLETDKKGGCLV